MDIPGSVSLPRLVIGVLPLMLSFAFVCYKWKLKRDVSSLDETQPQNLRGKRIIELENDLYNGRSIPLEAAHIKMYIDRQQSLEVRKGAFGAVFITKQKIKDYKTKLTITKMKDNYSDQIQLECHSDLYCSLVMQDDYVPRMHFAIVPYIAHYKDTLKRKCYLVSPYLDKGNLNDAFKSENHAVLDMKERMKIMCQIFSAIDYIHTPRNQRKTLLHLDITSKNIVLDAENNARLANFESAIELSDTQKCVLRQVQVQGGEMATQKLSIKTDYYSFGIVIRELVTGQDAEETELRNLNKDGLIDGISETVWKIKELAELAIDLSIKCTDERISVEEIRRTLLSAKTHLTIRTNSVDRWSEHGENRCELCLVNESVKQSILTTYHKCLTPFGICCPCLKNADVNPIICHTCAKDIKPFIGDGWGALLVAGYDESDEYNTFVEDIQKFAIVATSKLLPSMCIKTENMETIVPNYASETCETIRTKIEGALERLVTKADVHTLLFYYSGHNDTNNCLEIKKGCSYDLNLLPKRLSELREQTNTCKIKKTIVFLDCCYPKVVLMLNDKNDENGMSDDSDDNDDVNASYIKINKEKMEIQINAVGPNIKSIATKGKSSFFSSCIIQVLTKNASDGECKLINCTSNCAIIDKFISFDCLTEFIQRHSEKDPRKTPRSHLKNVPPNIFLAYNYEFPVHFQCKVHVTKRGDKGHQEPKTVTVYPPDCLDIRLLKKRLGAEFLKTLSTIYSLQLNKCVRMDSNVLCIECKSGPAEDVITEIDDIHTIPRKHSLEAKLRGINQIDIDKPVAIFLPNINIPTHNRKKTLTPAQLNEYKYHFDPNLAEDEQVNAILDAIKNVEKRINAKQLDNRQVDINIEPLSTEDINGPSFMYLYIK